MKLSASRLHVFAVLAALTCFSAPRLHAAPTISALTPSSGAIGSSITITGANFGSTQGSSTVKFNVIAQSQDGLSTSAFDSNGNAIGQVGNLPTYSWKGAYQVGSVDSLVPNFDLANIASTFAAVPGGNLTGNGFSLVQKSFGLVFCGPGFQVDDVWHGGDGPCPANLSIPSADFAYIPGIDDNDTTCPNNTGLPCTLDFSHDYPVLADTIKVQALNSYRSGFDHLAALVKAGYAPAWLYGGATGITKFDHTIFVRGDWIAPQVIPRFGLSSPPPGWTPPGSTDHSYIYYLPIMGEAQTELGAPSPGYGQPYMYLRPPYPPTTPQAMGDLQRLVRGIGTAIGNVAVHEIGWELNVDYQGCSSSTCENQDVNLYQYESTNTGSYTGQPKKHWGTAGTCTVENYLIPGSCRRP